MSSQDPRESTLVRAARGLPVDHTPVWFMRQAGRSLPEYRKVREGIPMLQSCRTPDLVAEITLQPVRRHKTDAAIFFSDIVVPLQAAGIDLDIVPGTGPVIANPVRSRADVEALPELTPGMIDDIAESVKLCTAELGGTPLIGFAGAPFTLASYLVEGGPSRNHEHTKALMYGDPVTWDLLCAKLARISATFLTVQIEAGASAMQLFDSWVGALNDADYLRFVQPHSRFVLESVESLDVPRIHFGVGTGELLPSMGAAGADVVGVDYRLSLDEAARRIGPTYAVQGNLDPALLFAPWEPLAAKIDEILEAGKAAKGHIFNLGHGVLPSTDPEVITRVVEYVHERSAR